MISYHRKRSEKHELRIDCDARYFLVALRAIVLKGAGIQVFWPQLIALVIYATFMLTMASRRLKRQWT